MARVLERFGAYESWFQVSIENVVLFACFVLFLIFLRVCGKDHITDKIRRKIFENSNLGSSRGLLLGKWIFMFLWSNFCMCNYINSYSYYKEKIQNSKFNVAVETNNNKKSLFTFLSCLISNCQVTKKTTIIIQDKIPLTIYIRGLQPLGHGPLPVYSLLGTGP